MATVWRWTPAVALMALLFFLSAQPDLDTGSGTLGLVVRKLGHAGAYGLLWLLVLYATRERAALSTGIALAYAVSDEWHQSFVEGRTGAPSDVAIDFLGMGVAAALWLWWRTSTASRARWP